MSILDSLTYELHDGRDAAPMGFEFVSNLPDDRSIHLEIGLCGRDTPGLVKRLYEISTPGSPSFREHLSKEMAESYTMPTAETMEEVHKWLRHYGVQFESISPSHNRLKITLKVGMANQLLKTTFSIFRHTETGTESFQALSYSLPSQLKNIIESVEPTTSFLRPPFRPTVQTFVDGLNLSALTFSDAIEHNRFIAQYGITPGRLAQRYSIPTAKATQKNVLAVPALGLNYANHQDLESFLGKYRQDLKGATFTEKGLRNSQIPDSPYKEGNIDIQYTVGLVNFSPVDFISSENTINGFIKVFDDFLKQEKPPTVVSLSYSFQEEDLQPQTMETLSNIYVQLGARGVSILVSTGDGGVDGSQHPTSKRPSYEFVPTFPASCPYVTAVGATKLEGNPDTGTEIGAPLSAGGFSRHFKRPIYQAAAVQGYLDQIGSLYSDRFNRNGRAFPDVSALGENVVIVANEVSELIAGTSVSTPIVASIIALLNDRLYNKGLGVFGHRIKSLGFLNPWLYAFPGVLNDIILGNDPGCGTEGFYAKPGWDPVTGLGSPDFEKMDKAIGDIIDMIFNVSATLVNGNTDDCLWLKHLDGTIQILPRQSKKLAANLYGIASVEMPPTPTLPVPVPVPAVVTIVNVGPQTLSFTSPAESFKLKPKETRTLKPVTYRVTSKDNASKPDPMTPSLSNGNKNHNLWINDPNGKVQQISPGASIVPNVMAPGSYAIASVENPSPVSPPSHLPPLPSGPTGVFVTNVGPETLIFICPTNVDLNLTLPVSKARELANVEYVVHSIHKSL